MNPAQRVTTNGSLSPDESGSLVDKVLTELQTTLAHYDSRPGYDAYMVSGWQFLELAEKEAERLRRMNLGSESDSSSGLGTQTQEIKIRLIPNAELFENPDFCHLIERIQKICEICQSQDWSCLSDDQNKEVEALCTKAREKFDGNVVEIMQKRIRHTGICYPPMSPKDLEDQTGIVRAIESIKRYGKTRRFLKAQELYWEKIRDGLLSNKLFGVYMRTLIAKQKGTDLCVKVLEEATEVYATAQKYQFLNGYIQRLFQEIKNFSPNGNTRQVPDR